LLLSDEFNFGLYLPNIGPTLQEVQIEINGKVVPALN